MIIFSIFISIEEKKDWIPQTVFIINNKKNDFNENILNKMHNLNL